MVCSDVPETLVYPRVSRTVSGIRPRLRWRTSASRSPASVWLPAYRAQPFEAHIWRPKLDVQVARFPASLWATAGSCPVHCLINAQAARYSLSRGTRYSAPSYLAFRAQSRSVFSTPAKTAAGSAAQNMRASSRASSNGRCRVPCTAHVGCWRSLVTPCLARVFRRSMARRTPR